MFKEILSLGEMTFLQRVNFHSLNKDKDHCLQTIDQLVSLTLVTE